MVVRGFFQPWKTSAPRFVAAFVVAFAGAGALRAAGSHPPTTTTLATLPASVTSAAHAVPEARTTPAVPLTSSAQNALAELGRRIFFDASLSEPRGRAAPTATLRSKVTAATTARRAACRAGVGRGILHGGQRRPSSTSSSSTTSISIGKRTRHCPTASEVFLGWAQRFAREPDSQPLTNPDEMGNRDLPAIAEKAARSSYAAALATQASGTDTEAVLTAMGKAVEAFLLSSAMAPFSFALRRVRARGDDAHGRGVGGPAPLQGSGQR